MKSILIFLFIACSSILYGQTINTQLDTALARKLGADENGMKRYVFVLLTKGDNNSMLDGKFIDSCFVGHLANITRLAKQKQLVVAGPFAKNDANFRGLFILNVATIEEATKLLQTDPAIKANLLKAELYYWYGSAAISEYLDFHDKIWKKKP